MSYIFKLQLISSLKQRFVKKPGRYHLTNEHVTVCHNGTYVRSSYGVHQEHTIQIVFLPKRSNLNLIMRTCSTESNWGHFSKEMVYTIKKYQYCPLCLNKAGKKIRTLKDKEGYRPVVD